MHDHEHENADPRRRPAEPDHPRELNGGVIAGDTEFMAACIFEEMLGAGLRPDQLLAMAADPEYQSLHAIYTTLGAARTEQILARQAARVGVMRPRIHEETTREQPASLTISAPHRPGNTARA